MNRLRWMIENLEKLNGSHIYVGIPQDDHFLTMVALVQETGKHIEAKHAPFLVIPTSNAKNQKPRDIPGLYRRGMALGVNDSSQSYGFRVCFVLRKAVNIPSRPFLTFTQNHRGSDWAQLLQTNVDKILMGKITGREAINIMGDRMCNDLKTTIHQYTNPRNAPLTVERKGFDNPLTDTGRLERSVTWFVTN